jgi:hypothetical protein
MKISWTVDNGTLIVAEWSVPEVWLEWVQSAADAEPQKTKISGSWKELENIQNNIQNKSWNVYTVEKRGLLNGRILLN